jgi:hypothetical protein
MFLMQVAGALSVVLPQIWQNLALSAVSVPLRAQLVFDSTVDTTWVILIVENH